MVQEDLLSNTDRANCLEIGAQDVRFDAAANRAEEELLSFLQRVQSS